MADPLADSRFRPLPQGVYTLLRQVSAPPRLIAHLIIVHDVAYQLAERISSAFPSVALDKDAVLFGAATHDLGKSVHSEELVQPGKAHEQRGYHLLCDLGVSESRARFALTHGNWDSPKKVGLEDFIVALADNCWKGKRQEQLETVTVEFLSSASNRPSWDCYAVLDDILESVARDADERLAWQGEFGV